MAKLGDLVVNIGANTKDLNKKLGGVRREMRSMTSNFKAVGMNLTRSLTMPLALMGGAAVKLAVDFESAMAQVKAVSGATGGEFKKLEQSAKNLGASTIFTAREVAGLQLEYSRLGFSANEILNVQEATLNLAQATGSDLAQAAEVAGATLRAFGLDAAETGRVTDVMAESFSSSALNINTFQDSMKFVAPDAKAAGVSIEETSAMLAVLANSGIKGSQAGTALRRILQEMSGTSGTLTDRFKALSAKGIGVRDAMDEVGRRAGSSLLVLTNGAGQVDELTSSFNNAEGAAARMADIMSDTARGQIKEMTSALEGAGIALGEVLIPFVTKAAGFIRDLATKFKNASPEIKKIVVMVGAIAGAIGPLLMILPTLGASLSGAFAIATGPIGIVVAGIAAMTIGFFKYFDQIEGPLTDHINSIITLYNEIDLVRVVVGGLEGAFTELGNVIIFQLNNIVNALDTGLGTWVTLFSEGPSAAIEHFEKAGTKLIADMSSGAIEIAGAVKKKVDEHIAREPIELLEFGDIGAKKDEILGLLDFKSWISETGAAADDLVSDLLNTLTEFGNSLIEIDNSLSSGVASATLGELNTELSTLNAELLNLVPGSQAFLDKMAEIGDLELQLEVGGVDGLLSHLTDFGNAVDVVNTKLDEFGSSVATALEQATGSFIENSAIMIATAIATGQPLENFGSNILGAFADLAISLGKIAISFGITVDAIKNKLLKNPGLAVAAGAALLLIGHGAKAAMNKAAEDNMPALAEGGLAFGPTTALIGDNKNARIDPEVVAPLSKLRDMMGGGRTNVYGRISGDDIVISNDRATRDRNRYI